MKDFSLDGKTVGILGWARSGRAAARLARELGADVFVSESRPLERLEDSARREIVDYEYEAGGHSERIRKTDIVILSPGIPPATPALAGYAGQVWSEIELGYRAMAGRVVAVTGTNGKTTTTALIGEVLKAGYTSGSVYVAGNIGNALCDIVVKVCDEDIVVLELSSFQLETIREFRPDIAVYLNLRSDHLDRYANLDEYARAKERIFMNMRADDVAILNLDDSRLRWLCGKLKMKVITVAQSGKADYTMTMLDERLLEAAKAPENLLSALAVADHFGLDRGTTKKALEEFRGLPHRMERLREVGGVTFWNDSKATNVASVEAALRTVPGPIVLILGGRDKNENYQDLMHRIREKCRAVIAYGEASDRIVKMIPAERVERFGDAVARAYELAKPAGHVLLSPACSSYDQFTDYKARGEEFRRIANSL